MCQRRNEFGAKQLGSFLIMLFIILAIQILIQPTCVIFNDAPFKDL